MDKGQGEGRVIPFGELRGGSRGTALSELRAYWEALRRGRTVPLRSDIDPRGIERALEYAFILERIAPQVARFRLAGMHLNDLMGMEVRGMPVTALFTPRARADIGRALEEVFARPAIAELTLDGEAAFARPPLPARMILLPLQSDLGDISRAIGCLVAEGPPGRAPRRFDLTRAEVTPVGTGASAHAPHRFALRGGDTAPRVERGHLRLVKSDG